MDAMGKRMLHFPGRSERGGKRFHRAIHNIVQFKTYGTLKESETTNKGVLVYIPQDLHIYTSTKVVFLTMSSQRNKGIIPTGELEINEDNS